MLLVGRVSPESSKVVDGGRVTSQNFRGHFNRALGLDFKSCALAVGLSTNGWNEMVRGLGREVCQITGSISEDSFVPDSGEGSL